MHLSDAHVTSTQARRGPGQNTNCIGIFQFFFITTVIICLGVKRSRTSDRAKQNAGSTIDHGVNHVLGSRGAFAPRSALYPCLPYHPVGSRCYATARLHRCLPDQCPFAGGPDRYLKRRCRSVRPVHTARLSSADSIKFSERNVETLLCIQCLITSSLTVLEKEGEKHREQAKIKVDKTTTRRAV